VVGGEAIGALIVQDLENEERFTDDHLRILSTLAAQVAVAIRNTRLLEQTRQLADRERLLHEVTSRIRGSIDMRNILTTTATELAHALGARKARIELRVKEPASLETVSPEAVSEETVSGETEEKEKVL
jgi:GAF domain-containing protein